MTPERHQLLGRAIDAVREELERRQHQGRVDDPREALINKLNAMEERLRNSPDFIELTEAEKAEGMRELRAWFKTRGYVATKS